jgi:hypothetical protein
MLIGNHADQIDIDSFLDGQVWLYTPYKSYQHKLASAEQADQEHRMVNPPGAM